MRLFLGVWLCSLCAVIAADTGTFKVGDFTFTRPAKWSSVEPSSPMRKAQLLVPADKGDGADVIFFHFGPGDGGGTQANVDRWLAQFSNAENKKVADEKIGKYKVLFVSTDGTYSGGMPGRPAASLPGYSLLGAIVETSGGNVFVKMTGPKAVVQSASADFRQMIASALK